MYITFDFKCLTCKQVDTRLVRREHMDMQVCTQGTGCDGTDMIRLPAGTRTTFRFADRKLKR